MDQLTKNDLIESQKRVLKQLTDFVFNSDDRVFVLKGYAGTGKTTLMKFLIDELEQQKQAFKLISTTGRAAKILANHTGREASTIHSMIYKFTDFNQDVSKFDAKTSNIDNVGQLFLVFEPATLSNDDRNSIIYIIDEASMVSDTEDKNVIQAKFGSGRLLTELLGYDDLEQSKFIFVGDPCQLPPILGSISPALSTEYFQKRFQLHAQQATLTEIMRQDNSIIAAGNYVRKLWENAPENESAYPKGNNWRTIQLSPYKDIKLHSNTDEMLGLYLETIKSKGYNEATFISYSNSKCSELSASIRQSLGFQGDVQKGDLLMVVQNQGSITGLMNGDMVEVVGIRPESERTFKEVKTPEGYHTTLVFREVTVKELFTEKTFTTLLLETLLESKQTNLDALQQSGLFLDFILRMKRRGIDRKRNSDEFERAMLKDPYLNALRCNYGYAITCHKAQGGEWSNVFIQPPRNLTLNPTQNKYQWFYTAITRAKQTVHLCKDFFIV